MTREEARHIIATWLVSSKGANGRQGYIEGWFGEEDAEAFRMAIEALSDDRPTGEWIDGDGNNVPLHKDGYTLRSCYCNQCHEWLVGSDEYSTKGNFCPNCGAKMGGDSE